MPDDSTFRKKQTPRRKTFEELVDRESHSIALGKIEQELTIQGLPLPKDGALATHIEALLSVEPGIRQEAENRVRAKQDAYSESLRAIGVDPNLIGPKDEAPVDDSILDGVNLEL